MQQAQPSRKVGPLGNWATVLCVFMTGERKGVNVMWCEVVQKLSCAEGGKTADKGRPFPHNLHGVSEASRIARGCATPSQGTHLLEIHQLYQLNFIYA